MLLLIYHCFVFITQLRALTVSVQLHELSRMCISVWLPHSSRYRTFRLPKDPCVSPPTTRGSSPNWFRRYSDFYVTTACWSFPELPVNEFVQYERIWIRLFSFKIIPARCLSCLLTRLYAVTLLETFPPSFSLNPTSNELTSHTFSPPPLHPQAKPPSSPTRTGTVASPPGLRTWLRPPSPLSSPRRNQISLLNLNPVEPSPGPEIVISPPLPPHAGPKILRLWPLSCLFPTAAHLSASPSLPPSE